MVIRATEKKIKQVKGDCQSKDGFAIFIGWANKVTFEQWTEGSDEASKAVTWTALHAHPKCRGPEAEWRVMPLKNSKVPRVTGVDWHQGSAHPKGNGVRGAALVMKSLEDSFNLTEMGSKQSV